MVPVALAMGFTVPGLGDLRFHLAETGVGDVHLRVDASGSGVGSGSSYDDLPPATWAYPLDTRLDLEGLRHAAEMERAQSRRAAEALAAASSAAERITDVLVLDEGRCIIEPTTPETVVLPTLPKLDPQFIGDEWGRKNGEINGNDVTTTSTGWLEQSIDTSGVHTNGVHRPVGASQDFVRGSTSNQPFTPGGEGWDKAAIEAAKARSLNSKKKSQTWLAEFEKGVFAGTSPGFAPSTWSDAPADVGMTDVDDGERDTQMPLTHDDLLLSALMIEKGSDDDITSDASDTASETSEPSETSETDDPDTNAHDSGNDSDLELDSVLRSVQRRAKSTKSTRNAKKAITEWCMMERLIDIDEKLRKEVPQLAKQFPFELDSFQKEAAYRLERNESVFVAAHTSAGKTVVAEYAFALATKHCTRAIYTSPIKTISNQKFRDFGAEFDVGLLTGDVSIKPDAPCLIMTTEILRSMLYRGADLIRDVEWVVFDEVHYVNDTERGVVWEEVIIMLPKHIGLVLLSATVPNVWEFADWVGRTKRKKVYVTGTTNRPVPLEHVLYFGGDKDSDFYKVGERETFLPGGYKAATDAINKSKKNDTGGSGGGVAGGRSAAAGRGNTAGGRGAPGRGSQKPTGNSGNEPPGRGGRGGQVSVTASGTRGRDKNAWVELIRTLERRELLPMVTFAFSKKRCDAICEGLNSLDLTTTAEKHDIHVFCEKCLSRLSPTDRKLPQVLRVRELLRRGLGVHHAGLLPIVKEIVEMLFCRGVVKVLFSTETFAMGVNAPARSVCFQDLRKHDGVDFRGLLPGEYTQMAGRAGRRGLDPVGTVIIAAWENFPTETITRNLLTGKATKLESQFRLTYGMILNLLRVEDLRVEDMLMRSFAEFHAQCGLGDKRAALALDVASLKKVSQLVEKELQMDPAGWSAVEVHDHASHKVRLAAADVNHAMLTSKGAQQAMQVGRVVLVAGGGENLDTSDTSDAPDTSTSAIDKLGVLLRICGASSSKETSQKTYVVLFPCPEGHPPVSETNGLVSKKEKEKPKELSATDKLFARKPKKYDIFGLGSSSGAKGKADNAGVIDGPLPNSLPWRLQSGGASFIIANVNASDVLALTDVRIETDAVELLRKQPDGDSITPDITAAAARTLGELEKVSSASFQPPAPLHPTKDLKITDVNAVEACHELSRLIQAVPILPKSVTSKLRTYRALLHARRILQTRIGDQKHDLSDANLRQMPDFENRVSVLQNMGYLDVDKTVTLKGRVACEIATGDELVGTEIIFAGMLTELPPEQAVAVLSSLVFQEKNAAVPDFSSCPELGDACGRCFDLAVSVGEEQARQGLPIDPPEYASASLKFGLTECVHEWAKGVAFIDACTVTDIQEGSIVRTVTRLDEMTRDLRNAARIMGDSQLFEKMELASSMIKRDIVFSASLYVAGAR